MTNDAHAVAVDWLTRVINSTYATCEHFAAIGLDGPCPNCQAKAILAGVDVEWRKLRLGPGRYDPQRAQPVIWVPGEWPKPQEQT